MQIKRTNLSRRTYCRKDEDTEKTKHHHFRDEMRKISAAKKSYKNVKCSPQSATSCSWHREISIKKVRNEVIHFHENDEPQGT